jgi:hypothetical protein
MSKRLIKTILIALSLAAVQGPTAAAPPQFLACELPDGSEFHVLIESFGKMHDAREHCLTFWNGKPSGRTR